MNTDLEFYHREAVSTVGLLGGEEHLINDIADHMPDENMGLLDSRTVSALGNPQEMIDFASHFPAGSPGQADGGNLLLPANLDGGDHIGRVTAR